MWDISPSLVRYDTVETPSLDVQKLGLTQLSSAKAAEGSSEPLKKPITNFYQTNPIARASVTMAACVKTFITQEAKTSDVDSGDKQVSPCVRNISYGYEY